MDAWVKALPPNACQESKLKTSGFNTYNFYPAQLLQLKSRFLHYINYRIPSYFWRYIKKNKEKPSDTLSSRYFFNFQLNVTCSRFRINSNPLKSLDTKKTIPRLPELAGRDGDHGVPSKREYSEVSWWATEGVTSVFVLVFMFFPYTSLNMLLFGYLSCKKPWM